MFRAFSDQMTGSSDLHATLRREVVDYMRRNREDFEPFVVDEISFDRHLELLAQDGTFGGNDSIVAFSRLKDATVVIHQLNEPLWQVRSDESKSKIELHISYHNGDHYNSVRKLNEARNLRVPANVSLNVIMLMEDHVKKKTSWRFLFLRT